MTEFLQKKHYKLFSRNPPQSPTVEIKDEINFLARTKILPEEMHVNRLVAWFRLTANTGDSPAPPTFQLCSDTSPPVELNDTTNLTAIIKKFVLDEVKLEQLVMCSVIVPLYCSTYFPKFRSASNYLQSPQTPCVEIKDVVNCNRKNQKKLCEYQIEDILIDYPYTDTEIASSHLVDRNTFLDENILQKPPVELSDRINTEVRLRRRSLSKNEIFEIRCFMPVFINHYQNLGNAILKDPPQKPDIDITDNCNKLAIMNVKEILEEVNDEILIIMPVSEDPSDGIKTHIKMFSICEPQPMEVILDDKVNRTTNISKLICDFSIDCDSLIHIPVGFIQSKLTTKLEFEPFDSMLIPADIEDHFQKNIFNFNRAFASDQEGIYFSFPSRPICSSVVKIDQFLEAAPQSPPPESEDRLNVVSGLRKIFQDCIELNIETGSLPPVSSDHSLQGSQLLAWSLPFPEEEEEEDVFSNLYDEKNISQKHQGISNVDLGVLLIPLLSLEDNPIICRPLSLGMTFGNIFSYTLHPSRPYLIIIKILVFDRLEDPEFDSSHSVLGSGLDSNIHKPTSPPRSERLPEIEDEPLQRRVLRKTFPVSKVPNVVIIFLPQKPTDLFAKKKNFVLEASQENLLAFLTEEIEEQEMIPVPVEFSERKCSLQISREISLVAENREIEGEYFILHIS